MADKLGLNPEIRELKLGSSFTNGRGSSFHTLRYDFKPASMDPNQMATLDVGSSNQVTVTVPHGSRETVFKGSHKPYQKECVLIIDNETGEITLERLTNNIQLKKTRTASTNKTDHSMNHVMQAIPSSRLPNIKKKTNAKSNNHKSSSKQQSNNHSSSNNLSVPGSIPRHSPLQASPSYSNSPSPHAKSPMANFKSTPSPNRNLSPMVNSLPMIGLDEMRDSSSPSPSSTGQHVTNRDSSLIGEISDDSSSSSSSNSSSDSDSDSSSTNTPVQPRFRSQDKVKMNGHNSSNGKVSPLLSVPELLLNEDLQLSESSGSSSDSD